MDELIGAAVGALVVGATVAYAVYRWMYRAPKGIDLARLHDTVQYGACRAGHTGPHNPEVIYPSEAAYKNDPLWTYPVGWHTVGRLVDSRDHTPRSAWTRTYAKDWRAIRREED